MTTARRVPSPPIDRPAAEARERRQTLADDVRADAREHAEAEVACGDRGCPTSRCRPRPSPTRRTRTRARAVPRGAGPRARATSTDGRSVPAREARARRVTTPVTIPTIAIPTHTTRHDAPSRSATPVTAAPSDAAAVEQTVKTDQPAGVVRERVGGDDVHHHVDEPTRGHRQHERGHEHREVRARTPRARATRPRRRAPG